MLPLELINISQNSHSSFSSDDSSSSGSSHSYGPLHSPLRTPSPRRKSHRSSLISGVKLASGLHRIDETPGDMSCIMKVIAPRSHRQRVSPNSPSTKRPPSPIPNRKIVTDKVNSCESATKFIFPTPPNKSLAKLILKPRVSRTHSLDSITEDFGEFDENSEDESKHYDSEEQLSISTSKSVNNHHAFLHKPINTSNNNNNNAKNKPTCSESSTILLNGSSCDEMKINRDKSYFLCTIPVTYFSSSPFESNGACGYKNIQMLVLSIKQLLNSYKKDVITPEYLKSQQFYPLLVDVSKPAPDIECIQEIIERAWSQGWDVPGSQHFESKLRGTHKWIGATEVYTFFSYLGIRCNIVDFHKPSNDQGQHSALLEWISQYFLGKHDMNRIILPFYLQYQGHSFTVIGIRGTKTSSDKNEIIILDPNDCTNYSTTLNKHKNPSMDEYHRELAEVNSNSPFSNLILMNNKDLSYKCVKYFSLKDLVASQYQIVHFNFATKDNNKLTDLESDESSITNYNDIIEDAAIKSSVFLSQAEREITKQLKSSRIP